MMTLVVGLLGAQAAAAAPARTLAIGASNPFVAFDGGLIANFNAVPGEQTGHAGRDDTLIKVQTPGKLAVRSTSDGLPTSEIDLELFKSDANGARDAEVAQGISDGPVEEIAAKVREGYYLLSASGYPAVTTSYKAELSLRVDAAPAPVAALVVPAVIPPQMQQPAPAKKALTCKQKARKIRSAKKRKAALRRCVKANRRRG
jgi:hypothetical protein